MTDKVLFAGFGPFPNTPVNATESMMRALAKHGKQTIVLPVEWAHAAELLLAESITTKATWVLMNGVAGARQPMWIESAAMDVFAEREDAAGKMPEVIRTTPTETVYVSIDVGAAKKAADLAFRKVRDTVEGGLRLDAIMHGATMMDPRAENAYVCNDTTWRVTRALSGTGARAGFFHWPHELRGAHVEAACDVLLAIAATLA